MKDLTQQVAAAFFAVCPDHEDAHLYMRQDGAGIFYQCRNGCDPLADRDVYLEWNERHTTKDDGQGPALYITEYVPAEY